MDKIESYYRKRYAAFDIPWTPVDAAAWPLMHQLQDAWGDYWPLPLPSLDELQVLAVLAQSNRADEIDEDNDDEKVALTGFLDWLDDIDDPDWQAHPKDAHLRSTGAALGDSDEYDDLVFCDGRVDLEATYASFLHGILGKQLPMPAGGSYFNAQYPDFQAFVACLEANDTPFFFRPNFWEQPAASGELFLPGFHASYAQEPGQRWPVIDMSEYGH